MKVMRKLIMLVMVIALMIPAGQAFSADAAKSINVSFAPIHYVINGVDYAPPEGQLGFISSEGHTYVPLRFVANILERTIAWDGATSKVTIAEPVTDGDLEDISAYQDAQEVKNSVIKHVDKKTVTSTAIPVYTRKVTYEFDGQVVEEKAATPGLFYKNSIYVPLRFIYESLGYEITFDLGTYTIETNSAEYAAIVDPNAVLINAKKTACTNEVWAMKSNFDAKAATITAEETAALVVEADALIADCRTDVDAMLDVLSKQLTDAGFSTNIVAKYKLEFDGLEILANSFIKKYRT